MKAVILLAVVALASCGPPRQRRSYDHEYYDNTLYSSPEVYTIRQPEYTTHSVAPVYHIPHRASAARYTVRVPVTYTYTVDQPVHSAVYHDAPRTYSALPETEAPVYSAPYSSYPVDAYTDFTDPWC